MKRLLLLTLLVTGRGEETKAVTATATATRTATPTPTVKPAPPPARATAELRNYLERTRKDHAPPPRARGRSSLWTRSPPSTATSARGRGAATCCSTRSRTSRTTSGS